MMIDNLNVWASAVNWDAWSAIGTIFAALTALILALDANGRSAREARARAAAHVHVMGVVAKGIRDILEHSIEVIESGRRTQAQEAARLALADPFETALTALDRLDMTGLPTAQSIDWFMSIRSQIQSVEVFNTAVAKGQAIGEKYVEMLSGSVIVLNQRIVAIEKELGVV